jgi:hypothetical protein
MIKRTALLMLTILCFGCSQSELVITDMDCSYQRPEPPIRIVIDSASNATFEGETYNFNAVKLAYAKRNTECYPVSILIAAPKEMEPVEIMPYVDDARSLGVNPMLLVSGQ